jgi:hypothetical protein
MFFGGTGFVPSSGRVLYDFVWQVEICGCVDPEARVAARDSLLWQQTRSLPVFRISHH